MTLSLNKSSWALKLIIYAILFLIIDIYYLHITNQNPLIGIADKNLVFIATSLLGIPLLITLQYFLKEHCTEIQKEKVSDIFGYTALIALFGGLLFFGIFWIGTPPTWLSDILIQTIWITAVGCFAFMPKKGSYNLAISMVFPFMAIIVYLCYRF